MARLPSTTDIASAFRSTIQRPSRLKQLKKTWRISSTDAFTTILSALYGKFLVVLGMAFPMSEVISPLIPHSFYEVFYLYLYIGSMFFFVYMYMMILRGNVLERESDETLPPQCTIALEAGSTTITSSPIESEFCPSVTQEYMNGEESVVEQVVPPTTKEKNHLQPTQHFGSFYLRMGAVAFGIGSMIYSGLEIGQYFELERNTKCHNVILAVTPATRMAFIFIQMYFIFLNEEQQIKATKHRMFSRFGLMHMIGTNLSVWLNVLIQETKHEILTFYNPENNTYEFNKQNHLYQTSFGKVPAPAGWNSSIAGHIRLGRSLSGPHAIYDCRRTNIIGSLVQNASPFLFPCTIEYSLICAAILYVVWRNISGVRTDEHLNEKHHDKPSSVGHYKKSPHHYSVDCAQAHKGLFMGILFLVLTIISLILFFVLISRPDLVSFAVMEVNICELSLYGMSTLATLIGMVQIRELKYSVSRNLQLDNILLVVAQTGIFIYSTFTIIGGHFTQENNTILVIITATVSLVQTASQTLFILDASKRSCVTPEQINEKPGREIVTFLLVTNLAMWAINTLEKSRADSHPIQLHFYGLWAWTIITHVSMPLAIFYRFHSTVCLCEIWKRAYKMRHTYLTEV